MATPEVTAPVRTGPARVSVVLVNYKAYRELEVCLATLREKCRAEIIVVDNASSRGEAVPLQLRFPDVIWQCRADNPGFAAGVNAGARLAHGEFLLLLNPDCVVDQDVCGVLAEWLDGQPQVGAVGSLVHDEDGSIQASARRFPDFTTGFAGRTSRLTKWFPHNTFSRRNLLTGPTVGDPILVDWVSGACLMVRRAAFERVGGMDEQFFLYWEDADLCFRLAQAGWRTAYHPGVAVTHLCGRSSQQSARSIRAFHDSALRYFVKHGGWSARVLAPLAYLALQARVGLKLLRRSA